MKSVAQARLIGNAPRPLITRKRSAQAAGSGVKERSSRTQDLTLAPLLDGAQRLEGRRIRQTPSRLGHKPTAPRVPRVTVDMCQPSTPASWGPTRATDKAGQFIDLEEQKQEPGRSAPAALAPQNEPLPGWPVDHRKADTLEGSRMRVSAGGVHSPGVCTPAQPWSVQVKCISHTVVCDMHVV